MFDGYGYMVGMHTFWWAFWVVMVIVVVLWARADAPARRDRPRETPHEVLRRRLANGEVSPEEYEKRKAVLDRDR